MGVSGNCYPSGQNLKHTPMLPTRNIQTHSVREPFSKLSSDGSLKMMRRSGFDQQALYASTMHFYIITYLWASAYLIVTTLCLTLHERNLRIVT